MKLITSEQPVDILVAHYVKQRINKAGQDGKKPFVIAFPTGGTAVGMYKQLVKFYEEGSLSFKNVVSFNLDEYAHLPVTHPESYHHYMYTNLFSHVDMPEENINIPDGNAPDIKTACLAYEAKIRQYGGIDLFLGGVGENGHIAFNEPYSPFDSITRLVDLTESTIKANARFFDNNINLVPKQAVTMGLSTIYNAREVIIMAMGSKKAQAVYRAMEGKRDTAWPITVLQGHADCYIAADAKAASEVSSAAIEDCGVCSFKL